MSRLNRLKRIFGKKVNPSPDTPAVSRTRSLVSSFRITKSDNVTAKLTIDNDSPKGLALKVGTRETSEFAVVWEVTKQFRFSHPTVPSGIQITDSSGNLFFQALTRQTAGWVEYQVRDAPFDESSFFTATSEEGVMTLILVLRGDVLNEAKTYSYNLWFKVDEGSEDFSLDGLDPTMELDPAGPLDPPVV